MLTPRMGHADSWSLSLDGVGTTQRSADKNQITGQVWAWQPQVLGDGQTEADNMDPDGRTLHFSHGVSGGLPDAGLTQTGSTSGNFSLVLHWTPTTAGEKIPPFVRVRFWQEAIADGGRVNYDEPNSYYGQSDNYGGQALKGTPGSVTLTTSAGAPDGQSYSDATHAQKLALPSPNTKFSSYSATPLRLLTISTQGATPTYDGTTKTDGSLYVIYPLPPVSATFRVVQGQYNDPDGFPIGDGSTASVHVTAHGGLDNRSVQLTRNSKDRVAADSRGASTTQGDTLFAYIATDTGHPIITENPQTIIAAPNSSWGAAATWSWATIFELPANGDTKTAHVVNAPVGTLKWDGSQFTGTPDTFETRTTTYTMTDVAPGDGAVGTATYDLTYHDEIELFRNDTAVVYYETDYFDGDGHTPTVSGPATTAGSSYGMTTTTSNGFIVGGTAGGWKKFKTLFGFSASWIHSKTASVSLAPTNNGTVLDAGQFVNLVIRHNYNRHHALFNQYTVNGKVRRFINPPTGSPAGTPLVEVPWETFEDEYANDEARWSAPKTANGGTGIPTPATPQPTAPPAPSYTYN